MVDKDNLTYIFFWCLFLLKADPVELQGGKKQNNYINYSCEEK
jgi:hypothetical protein